MKQVQVSATINGKTVTGTAWFNVLRPDAQIITATSSVGVNSAKGFLALIFGNVSTNGIRFSRLLTLPDGFSGSTEWVQVDSNPVRKFQDTNSVWWVLTEDGSGPYLDSSYPYPPLVPPIVAADIPYMPVSSAYLQVTASDSMEMWLLFKPDGGQWVPLRAVNWSWSGSATNNAGTWTLESGAATSVNPPDFNTTTFPQWNSNVTNFVYQSQ